MGTKKNFVLDTNVILHDYKCLFSFEDNDIFIPIIVLEELDRFKKGNEQINFNAREFVRLLDEISDENLFLHGAELGAELGRLSIVLNTNYSDVVANAFPEKRADHIILSTTLQIAEQHSDMRTILVTKDVNLRMKARSLGIEVQNYITDTVRNVDIYERAHRELFTAETAVIDEIYKSHQGVAIDKLQLEEEPKTNECFVLSDGNSSVLCRYLTAQRKVRRIKKERNFGIEPRNAEQSFAFELLNDPNIQLLAITGKAGTGKTLLALAAALSQNQLYKQILLARPIVALGNKDMGFLPGDEKQKIAPYMQPLYDNLNVIKHQFTLDGADYRFLKEIQESGQLVIEALAYIRGRSLNKTFFIIDEAQNLTPHEIKTIVTRAGEGTKIVLTGDIQQIDAPYLDIQSNGLVYLIEKMQGESLFGHINLVKGERSELAELASNLL